MKKLNFPSDALINSLFTAYCLGRQLILVVKDIENKATEV